MSDESALVRGLGRWDLTAIVINIVVGAGIPGLPAKFFSLVGAYCLPGWVSSAVLIILRRRANTAPAGFSVPAGNLVAVVGFVGCLWLMFAVSAAELMGVGLILALGVMLNIGHLWYRRAALTQGG